MDDLRLPGFEAADGTAYLNTAAMGLGYGPAAAGLRAAIDAWTRGRLDFVRAEQLGELCRGYVADLVGAEADDVALIPTASAIAGQVAAHLARTGGGGSILVGEQEYTSALFPWLMLQDQGFDVRLVPYRDGRLLTEDVDTLADDSTRLIAVSAVQASTGWRSDLAALRGIADRSGALLYVDAAQAAGSIRLDARATRIDVLAAPPHKFLLGTRGLGYAVIGAELRAVMQPIGPGWKAAAQPLSSFFGPLMELSATASRYDQSLAWLAAFGDHESLALLTGLGIDRIDAYRRALVEHLTRSLRDSGVPFLDHPEPHRSALVSVAPASADAGERLTAAGVVAASRAGRIRLSVHVTTSVDDLDRAVAVLRQP